MVDQKLLDFVKKELGRGTSEDEIRSLLKKKGWPDKEINEAIKSFTSSDKSVTYCWNCGAQNDETAKACKNCGVNLEEIPEETVLIKVKKECPRNYSKIILLILLILLWPVGIIYYIAKKEEIDKVHEDIWFLDHPFITWVLVILVFISAGFVIGLTIGFTSGVAEEVEDVTKKVAREQVRCATDVVFDIKSVCKSGSDYKISIQNNGKEGIAKWKVRFYQDESKVESTDSSTFINAFDISDIIVTPPTITEVRKIELIPIIRIAGTDVVCAQNIAVYSPLTGEPIPKCA